MSKQREALKRLHGSISKPPMSPLEQKWIKIIEEALSEPEQEPVTSNERKAIADFCSRAEVLITSDGETHVFHRVLPFDCKSKQEPVAWMCADEAMTRKGYSRFSRNCEGEWNIPVYTTPPARKPLTDDEIDTLADATPGDTIDSVNSTWHIRLARAIEKAHGIGEK